MEVEAVELVARKDVHLFTEEVHGNKVAGDVEHDAAPFQPGIVMDVDGADFAARSQLPECGQTVAPALDGVGREADAPWRHPQAVARRRHAVGRRGGEQDARGMRRVRRAEQRHAQSVSQGTQGGERVGREGSGHTHFRRHAQRRTRRGDHLFRLGNEGQDVGGGARRTAQTKEKREEVLFHKHQF